MRRCASFHFCDWLELDFLSLSVDVLLKWLYLVHRSSLPNVVSLEGEIVDLLKILRDLFQTSSYSFLELYWIGCLRCKSNHSPLLLISLILAIFVFDLLTLFTLLVY